MKKKELEKRIIELEKRVDELERTSLRITPYSNRKDTESSAAKETNIWTLPFNPYLPKPMYKGWDIYNELYGSWYSSLE